jgi:hypothetical protein
MKYFSETKEIKDVCVLGEDSRFWGAPNLSELLETIRVQMENNSYRVGIIGEFNIEDVAFLYDTPRITENGLYVDVKIMDTPKGRLMIDSLTESCRHIINASYKIPLPASYVVDIPAGFYRITLVGTGMLESDNSVRDYRLLCLKFDAHKTFSLLELYRWALDI